MYIVLYTIYLATEVTPSQFVALLMQTNFGWNSGVSMTDGQYWINKRLRAHLLD